jgi:nucleoid DNA-binding protein
MNFYTLEDRLRDIVRNLAEKHNIKQDDAALMINTFEKNIRDFMKVEKTIRVPNMGTFIVSQKKKKKKLEAQKYFQEHPEKLKQKPNKNNENITE